MRAITLFFVAGLLEIGGGYLVRLWLREPPGELSRGLELSTTFRAERASCPHLGGQKRPAR